MGFEICDFGMFGGRKILAGIFQFGQLDLSRDNSRVLRFYPAVSYFFLSCFCILTEVFFLCSLSVYLTDRLLVFFPVITGFMNGPRSIY